MAAKGFKVKISVSGCSNKKINMHRSTYGGKKTNYKSNDILKSKRKCNVDLH